MGFRGLGVYGLKPKPQDSKSPRVKAFAGQARRECRRMSLARAEYVLMFLFPQSNEE